MGGGGFLQGGGGDDGALRLIAVDIGHIGSDPGYAVFALLGNLGIPLVHGVSVGVLHRTLNGLLIRFVVNRVNRQERHRLLNDQLLAHPDLVNHNVGVKLAQF